MWATKTQALAMVRLEILGEAATSTSQARSVRPPRGAQQVEIFGVSDRLMMSIVQVPSSVNASHSFSPS